jgi:magnesium-transporting ATPase (P-type)
VTNGLQDVALAFDPGEEGVLDRGPRRHDEGILSRALWVRTVLTGTAMALGSLWLFTWAAGAGLTSAEQRGAALTTLVVAMAGHVYTARSERHSVVRTGVRGNRFLLGASIAALVMHVGASHWAPTQQLLRIAPVTAAGWVRILLVALVVVLVSEIDKWRRRRSA